MGRKRINRSEEETKRLRQQYYQYHREEILKKAKENRLKATSENPTIKTETAFERLLNHWTEELSHKLQENLPQWLKIALEEQIILNKAMLTNQYEKKDNGLLLSTQRTN